MKPLLDLMARGGPVMIAIIALSVLLYSRCCKLLLVQWRGAHAAPEPSADADMIQASFRHERMALGAMIAAAPLLGLLGTVSGMVETFESLSSRTGQKSMEGLARGISEVLVATESGLLVALPALLLVYLAHRAMLRRVDALNRRGPVAATGTRP
ncbi:MAG TPA: MotA/TolQ/ExbB proton channel family protein [Lacunisphaera sp.]|nr:MotA/TolQ/ExbB proton channel family protein [Lacunisphaera sp.]